MRSILDNITGRAVVLGLMLHAAACAHGPAAPTTRGSRSPSPTLASAPTTG